MKTLILKSGARTVLFLSLFALFFTNCKVSSAQVVTTSTDRALYNLKESISELVTAKDKNDKNSLAYRIVAFKQVIDLSLAEAEEIRTKLATVAPLPTEQKWHEKTLKRLSESATYFRSQRALINGLQIKSTEEIRAIAEKLKNWREENYIENAEAATDYIAVKEASQALAIAEARREKIGNDLELIPTLTSPSRARVLGELSNLHLRSRDVILLGAAAERQAYLLFSSKYLLEDENSTSTPSSTVKEAAFYLSNSYFATTTSSTIQNISNSTTTPTSSLDINTPNTTTTSSTIPMNSTLKTLQDTEELVLQSSIKDSVRGSLTNVQEAYRIFIEMSRVVRTLL